MKKNILLLLFSVFAISLMNAQSIYKITFSYDNAGNQIQRNRVCLNCKSTKTKTPADSIAIVETPKEIDLLEEKSKITAYPNPVTDILQVEWLPSKNKVKQIMLFSIDNKQLFSQKINQRRHSIDLNFSSYPLGSYIVLVIYSDNTKQSFQVIKK